jgi:hypothetical protein
MWIYFPNSNKMFISCMFVYKYAYICLHYYLINLRVRSRLHWLWSQIPDFESQTCHLFCDLDKSFNFFETFSSIVNGNNEITCILQWLPTYMCKALCKECALHDRVKCSVPSMSPTAWENCVQSMCPIQSPTAWENCVQSSHWQFPLYF